MKERSGLDGAAANRCGRHCEGSRAREHRANSRARPYPSPLGMYPRYACICVVALMPFDMKPAVNEFPIET